MQRQNCNAAMIRLLCGQLLQVATAAIAGIAGSNCQAAGALPSALILDNPPLKWPILDPHSMQHECNFPDGRIIATKSASFLVKTAVRHQCKAVRL